MASAHPKFPINGAGMVGVEIGSTTRAQSEPVVGQLLRNAEIPFTYFQPPNKRQKITPNRSSTTKRNKHSPNRSPGSTSRHRSGASGRIPREQPASHNVTASKGPTADIIKPMESNDSASNIPSIASLFQNAYPGMLEKDNNNSSTDGDDDERMSALSPSFAPNLPVFPEMMDPVVYDTAEISTASQ